MNELKKDMENMENVMIRLGNRTDIWQDRIIYVIAKAVFDLCRWAIRREKPLKDLEKTQEVTAQYWVTVGRMIERGNHGKAD